MESIKSRLAALGEKIAGFGKENLDEMLHAAAEGARLVAGQERIRIYLEDLTRGALACSYASGSFAGELREATFPIISRDAMVSSVFVSQYPAEFRATDEHGLALDKDFVGRFNIAATYLLPITSHGKSIGVTCIDQETPGEVLNSRVKRSSATSWPQSATTSTMHGNTTSNCFWHAVLKNTRNARPQPSW